MKYKRREKYRQIQKQHAREKTIFLQHGSTENDDLRRLHRADLRQIFSDAKFYHNIADTPLEAHQHKPHTDTITFLNIVDDIENINLYNALLSLSGIEQDILFSHVLKGEPLKDIARGYKAPENTIRGRFRRIKNKIKKFFA